MGFFFAILAAVLWGFGYALDQRVLTQIRPSEFMVLSSVFCLIIYGPTVWFDHSGLILITQDMKVLRWVSASLLVSSLAGVCALYAIVHLGSVIATLVELSYVLFTALFVFMIYGETLKWQVGLGAALILTGVLTISTAK